MHLEMEPPIDFDTLTRGMSAIEQLHGPWLTHNVALPHGVQTIGPEPKGDNIRASKFLKIARDVLRRPIEDLRVLDLGCGEGLYALEFARRGARVIGIEGREANLAKAEFCRRTLALDRAEFILEDVRDVTFERLGAFDVVLCSGILYHIEHPAVFRFLRELRRMCLGICIIDTRIALLPEKSVEFEGKLYEGSSYMEHPPGASAFQKSQACLSSLDNEESFWLTRRSLCEFLDGLGYSSVFECLRPLPFVIREDRATFVAIADEAQEEFRS